MKRAKIVLILVITTALTACQNLPGSSPTSAVRITPTPDLPTKPATLPPTPQVIVVEDVTLRPGASQGDWIVLGKLTNDSAMKLSSIEIEVSLLGDEDTLIAQQVIPTTLHHLTSGQSSPFIARFTESGLPTHAEAEIVSYQTAIFTRGELEINDLVSTPTEEGGLAILGRLTNVSEMSLAIHRLGLVAVGSESSLLDITTNSVHPTILEPGDTSPFLAILVSDLGDADLTPYYDATATVHPTYPVLTLSHEPSLKFTAQGTPFVVGEIHNPDDNPRWATFLVELKLNDVTIGVTSIAPPTPLEPKENRAFTVASFPGLRSKLAGQATQPDDMRLEIIYDARASSPSNVTFLPLDLNISLYETIGSSLIVRGMISNTGAAATQSAIVYAAMRSTSGEPLTAGWLEVTDILRADESVAFTLPLMLPQGADPAMSEYDFQAIGLAP